MSNDLIQQAINAVSEKLFDKPEQIKLAFACIFSGGHLLVEDKPGLGKTTLANAMAQVLGLKFSRIQFTSDMLPSDVLGVSIFQPNSGNFKFFKGPIFTQLLLADELNRGTPRTQSALLEAMAEKQVSIDGQTFTLEKPFFVIATQNPSDDAGTFPLPDSQLDRFSLSISLGYPSKEAERKLYASDFPENFTRQLSTVINQAELKEIQKKITKVHASDEIVDYLQTLIAATRESNLFVDGLSPRAGLALFRASQALAFIAHRNFVIPDDIQAAFLPVAQHRLRSRSSQQNVLSQLNTILNTSVPI